MGHILQLLATVVALSIAMATGDPPSKALDPDVMKAAEFAIGLHNRMSNYPNAYKVLSIESEASQIYPPARVKYTVKAKVGETVCKNTEQVNLSACSLRATAETMTCEFVVLAIPKASFPTNSYLLSNKCDSA